MKLDDMLRDVRDSKREIEELADQGRVVDLVRLARALELDPEITAPPSVLEALFRHILHVLAMVPTLEAADAVIGLMAIDRVRTASAPAQRPRGSILARMLGRTHTRETCAAVIDRHRDDQAVREALACWVQERVVRGRLTAHPLGQLPLHRLAIEDSIEELLPVYSLSGGDTMAIPFFPDELPLAMAPAPTSIETRALDTPPGLAAVFDALRDAPGGAIDARVLAFVEPASLDPSELSATVMRRVPLACFEGAKTIELRSVDASSAFALLFAVAANRGPRGHGRGAGYARLDTWQTFAALVDRDPSDFVRWAASASHASFFQLRSDGRWYLATDWDFGLVCLRAGGGSLAVIAATHVA